MTGKLLFLGLFFVLINIPGSFLIILGAEKLVNWLKSRPRVLRGIDFPLPACLRSSPFKIVMTQGK